MGVEMHTDTTTNKKPTGSANNPAGHTDSASISGAVCIIKHRLIRLAAWLALVFGGVA